MILRDLLKHFNINESFPDYLLDESFNEVFLDGDLSKTDNSYKIEIKTRQDVIHTMYLNPDDDFPVKVMSKLPSGKLNGIKFGHEKDDLTFVNEL
ncbi:hypothetical protein [Methanobrevibacter sp.]|uniref:hypothetical protein n=1 Tax=Methanobrevibacter sp. TaxID=66852 RepID=UPI0025FD7834|nr:hypothetical protein [Methanobrevibacter sp.]MBQ6511858.1 hypothetical protein [Methanobrevibacter sp.]